MSEALLNIAFTIIELIICYMFLSAFLPTQKQWKTRMVLYYLLMLLGVVLQVFFYHYIFNLLLSLGNVLLMIILMFKGSLTRKVFILTLYMVLSVIVEFIVPILFNMNDYSKLLLAPSDNQFLLLTVSIFLKFLISLWLKIRRNQVDINTNNKLFLLQSIVPVLSIVFIIVFLNAPSGVVNLPVIYIFIIMLALINIIQYIQNNKIEAMYIRQNEVNILDQRNEYLSEYIENIKCNIQEIKMMKHDMKNKLLFLSGYIKDNENSMALEEIGNIVNDINDTNMHMFTFDDGINSLLSAKYNKAKEKCIDIEFNIILPKEIGIIDIHDLVSLFGNLLDNAIESCEKVIGEKHIDFELKKFKGALLVSMRNSTNGDTVDLKTKKSDKQWHGLGMKIIESIANKYKGFIEWEVEDNEFKIKILLNCD